MIIYEPYIIDDQWNVRNIKVCCDFEIKDEKKTLWYSVDKKYKDYINVEKADAFLVGLLVLAIKEREDTHLHALVSPNITMLPVVIIPNAKLLTM